MDDIYCKYLLPYDTLSEVEREELLRLVEEEHGEYYKNKLEKVSGKTFTKHLSYLEVSSCPWNYECSKLSMDISKIFLDFPG